MKATHQNTAARTARTLLTSFALLGLATGTHAAPGVDAIDAIESNGPPPNVAYLQTGLHQAWDTDGIELLRNVHDNDTTGGSIILAANAGGGLDKNCWSGVVNIPFPFHFYGEAFTKFCVSKHGLLTFTTAVANQALSTAVFSIDVNWPLPNPFYPARTIACFHGRLVKLDSSDHVRAYLYGSAPKRQVWIVFGGHNKLSQKSTYTALVLEETSNHIYMVDMHTERELTDVGHGYLTLGLQKDMTTFDQVPQSPNVPLINTSLKRTDNDFYLFKPYVPGAKVSGKAAPGLEEADAAIASTMRKLNIPGMTVAATKDGRLVFNKAYGYADVEQNIQMQPTHRSGIGSCSKVVTAIGIMKLHEMGVLPDLDAEIYANPAQMETDYVVDGLEEGFLEGLHTAQDLDAFASITPRHLLSHTAGFARSADDEKAAADYNGGDYATVQYSHSIQWFFANKKLLSYPGTETHYSNSGYGHLGQLTENITGMGYEDFIQQFILQPIGIDEMRVSKTSWHQQEANDAKRYHYYKSGMPHLPSKFDGVVGPIAYGHGRSYGPQGSWTATAADLARLMCATDRLPNQSDILEPGTLDTMETVWFPAAGGDSPRTLGWGLTSGGTLNHNGLTSVGRAWMCKYANGINVAICANTGNGSLGKSLADTVMNLVEDAAIPVWYDQFPPRIAGLKAK